MTLCFAPHMASAAIPETLGGVIRDRQERRAMFFAAQARKLSTRIRILVLPICDLEHSSGRRIRRAGRLAKVRESRAGRPFRLQTGSGCGWDYPCPPDPGFGRPPRYRGGQVTIHNNYGSVNIYPGVSRRPETPAPASQGFAARTRAGMGVGAIRAPKNAGHSAG